MPAYKSPKHFPGIEKLGPLAQTLIERFFPADELPTVQSGGILPKSFLGKIESLPKYPTRHGNSLRSEYFHELKQAGQAMPHTTPQSVLEPLIKALREKAGETTKTILDTFLVNK